MGAGFLWGWDTAAALYDYQLERGALSFYELGEVLWLRGMQSNTFHTVGIHENGALCKFRCTTKHLQRIQCGGQRAVWWSAVVTSEQIQQHNKRPSVRQALVLSNKPEIPLKQMCHEERITTVCCTAGVDCNFSPINKCWLYSQIIKDRWSENEETDINSWQGKKKPAVTKWQEDWH